MATTKIWDIKGWIGHALNYVGDAAKTANPEWPVSPETQDMLDVMENAMADAKARGLFKGLPEALEYIANDSKTQEQYLVSGINCSPATARQQMMATKRQWNKEDKIVAFHGYQSFAPGEVTPDKAHEIGMKLANALWGDRFEVVVATHIDKSHIHNHFVLNSVSFVDGYKYNDCNKTYMRMRQTSDRLCRENKLSVIEHPAPGKTKHYTEWQAEKESKPTARALIRKDIDRALVGSLTFTQLLKQLRAMGYIVKTDVKHIAVKPPGGDRFIRLRSLGDQYTAEALQKRILQQKPSPPAYQKQPRKARRVIFRPPSRPTWRGLRALYYYYLYKLREARRTPDRAPAFFVREEVRQMERISTHTKYLQQHGFSEASELRNRKSELEQQIWSLCRQRKRIQAEIPKRDSPQGKEALAEQVRQINAQLKVLRKEVRLCDDILVRSVAVAQSVEKIKTLLKEQARESEEVEKHADRRRSGSTHQYDTQRR